VALVLGAVVGLVADASQRMIGLVMAFGSGGADQRVGVRVDS
jgi:hypothetical protein